MLALGTNDTGFYVSDPNSFRSRFRELLRRLCLGESGPTPTLVLSPLGKASGKAVGEMAEIMRRETESQPPEARVAFVDASAIPDRHYQKDKTHLTPEGQQGLARLLLRPLAELLPAASRRGDPGILNPGELCYATSLWQALTHAPAAREVLSSEGEAHGALGTMRLEFAKMRSEAEKRKQHVALSARFTQLVQFGRGQQDAQELLARILHALDSESLRGGHGFASNLDMGGEQFADLFRGEVEQVYKCRGCPKLSKTTQPVGVLTAPPLPANGGKPPQVEASLYLAYPRAEVVRAVCTGAHSKGKECDHELAREWSKFPPILCVHVLRFDEEGRKTDPALYDLSGSPELALSSQRYELRSAVEHIGDSSNSGHYVAFARVLDGGEPAWWKFDDRDVRPSTEREATRRPYLLFYERVPDGVRRAPTVAPLRTEAVGEETANAPAAAAADADSLFGSAPPPSCSGRGVSAATPCSERGDLAGGSEETSDMAAGCSADPHDRN